MCKALLPARSPPRCRRCRLVLPDDAGIGATPQRWANAASLRNRSGLSPTVISSAATVSGPSPNTALVAGAAAWVSSSSCFRRERVSVLRCWTRRAIERKACLAAWTGSARLVRSGRRRAQAVTNCAEDRVRSWVRNGSGAVMTIERSVLRAAVRALTAPLRATRSIRMASIGPSASLGAPLALPPARFARRLRRRLGRSYRVAGGYVGLGAALRARRCLDRAGSEPARPRRPRFLRRRPVLSFPLPRIQVSIAV